MNEKQIMKQISDYFIGLGYKETMFERESSLHGLSLNSSRADFVVSVHEKPHIVVEAKIGIRFTKINVDELKYDPSVRQIQMHANQINAPFFVITDGKEFLWFKTDENGRPLKIEAIKYDSNLDNSNQIEYPIERVLFACMNELRNGIKQRDCMYDLMLILLARINVADSYSDRDSYDLKNTINQVLQREYYSFDFRISLDENVTKEALNQCWYILSDFDLKKVNPEKFVDALNNIVPQHYHYSYRVSNKLADFMIRLSQINNNQDILDPVSNLGDITSKININANIYSYCQSREQYVFLILRNLTLGRDISKVKMLSFDEFILNRNNDYHLAFDRVITALPFGIKKDLNDYRYRTNIDTTNLEDYLIVTSMEKLKDNGRLVTIVPDSLLFAGGKRERFRRFLLDNCAIRTIISLPVGALPNTGAKTSIIVIDKSNDCSNEIFFGMMTSEDFNQSKLFIDENGSSIALLKAYEDFVSHNKSCSNEFYKSVEMDYKVDNLRPETFLMISDSTMDSKYPLYHLNEICLSISRGSAIKNDPNGDIPFIGPAAVRAHKLDENGVSFTSDELTNKSLVYAEKQDIVMNNISSHLGAATTVKLDEATAINQHIVLFKPNLSRINPEYLSIVLNNKDVKKNILLSATGTAIPSITLKHLREIKIPVPELDEQLRIVEAFAKVQEELNQLEELKSNLQNKLNTIVDTLSFGEV